MRGYIVLVFLFFSGVYCFSQPVRELLRMDRRWHFHLGDANNPEKDFRYGIDNLLAKAGQPGSCVDPAFDDSKWQQVDLPHDWVPGLDFVRSDNFDVMAHGFKPVGALYPETSIGWYRKTFYLSKADQGKRIAIRFDGVFRDCKIWINGLYVGQNFSGYSGFSFDVTDYLRYDRKNVLVVRADASQYEGWFYEGAGIYRHVWLMKYQPVHVTEGGVFVWSEGTPEKTTVWAETELQNESDAPANCMVSSTILDADGKVVAESNNQLVRLSSKQTQNIRQSIRVEQAHRWSLTDPYRYRMVTRVHLAGQLTDSLTTRFGIRSVVIDKDLGLLLNGQSVKIQGVCCHQDHAGVGSALPDDLQYYRIGLLKEMGVNAYRTSHNPPTPELLDACDSLGMLVLDENRLMGSTPEFMGQWERQLRRDRNHPSVFMWSIGNEEWVIHNDEIGRNIAISMLQRQKALDPTRLSTYAGNNGSQYEGVNEVIPVRGFNYYTDEIDPYRKLHPNQPILGSEVASTVSTRGVFHKDTINGYLEDLDLNKPDWGSTAERWWTMCAERPWMMGGFVWTGFDYRGEPTPYGWPCINSHFGIMDMCGFPKSVYYYYQSWWTQQPVLYIAPDWNGKRPGEKVDVWCWSNADSVELVLNSKSLGKKAMPRNGHLQWATTYEPGKLEARGWKEGKLLLTVVETTGIPYRIKLSTARKSLCANGESVAVVNVSVFDKEGREVPNASNLIHFDLKGRGKILGVGNGDPSSHEADQCGAGRWQRRLFNGHCQVIVQGGDQAGTLTLQASAEGVTSDSVQWVLGECPVWPTVSEKP